jgi:hypothetical protein
MGAGVCVLHLWLWRMNAFLQSFVKIDGLLLPSFDWSETVPVIAGVNDGLPPIITLVGVCPFFAKAKFCSYWCRPGTEGHSAPHPPTWQRRVCM